MVDNSIIEMFAGTGRLGLDTRETIADDIVSEKEENSEVEEQRYGRNKNTTIDRSYVNGGEYRRKFDLISKSPDLNRLLYQLAKKMLEHRSGTRLEDMFWVDPKTCEIVAEEINNTTEEEIIYSESTIRKIQGRKGLITMHSHPNSFPPSISDLNSNFVNEYDIGIVICHDGKIYIYLSDQEINPGYYQLVVEEFRKNGYNDFEAQEQTLHELQKNFDISCKEVTEYGYGT